MELIKLNKYLTKVTQELLDTLPEELQEELIDTLVNVPFVKNLISSNRPYAKDLPRDSKNRIIVDLVNPHILEDMDYFRESAIHFLKHGIYNKARPNANPNSEYGTWIRRERDRCWNGMVRESDGEWIPGALYFNLNYCPIIQVKIREGTKLGDRIVDFPQVWEGIYWRFHYIDLARSGGKYNNFEGGNHGAELASRGKSKSYSMASIAARNFILGENKEAWKETRSLITASSKQYLTVDGVLNKFVSMIDFVASNTLFPRKRLKSSYQDMMWTMGYKDAETDLAKGTQNQVIGVSSRDDESKLRGKRAVFIGIEEFGSFARLIDLYNNLKPSVQEGEIIFGLMYLQGTAGDKESDFSGAQEIMYNPRGYNMYALPNVFDKDNQGRKDFVFFYPGYVNNKNYYNTDGVSDVVGSLIQIIKERYKVKYNSDDPNTILKTIAEIPITPAEAIIKSGLNMFPVMDLTARLLLLDANPSEFDEVYIADIQPNSSGEMEYSPSAKTPIRTIKNLTNKLEGAVEILLLPEKDRNGRVFNNRYILSCDPYDNDLAESQSLGSTFVLDLWTDKIVAEYTGRPLFADDFYEVTRRLCLIFNGRLNYENNKKGLFGHFLKMNSLYLIVDNLEFLKDKELVKTTGFGNSAKGTYATAGVNNYARMLYRNWLMQPVTTIIEEDGEQKEVTVSRLFTVKNRALLEESIAWNAVGNFDRVSSMMMLMLLREDRLITYGGNIHSSRADDSKDSSYLGNDPFFNNNYSSLNIMDNMLNS